MDVGHDGYFGVQTLLGFVFSRYDVPWNRMSHHGLTSFLQIADHAAEGDRSVQIFDGSKVWREGLFLKDDEISLFHAEREPPSLRILHAFFALLS